MTSPTVAEGELEPRNDYLTPSKSQRTPNYKIMISYPLNLIQQGRCTTSLGISMEFQWNLQRETDTTFHVPFQCSKET